MSDRTYSGTINELVRELVDACCAPTGRHWQALHLVPNDGEPVAIEWKRTPTETLIIGADINGNHDLLTFGLVDPMPLVRPWLDRLAMTPMLVTITSDEVAHPLASASMAERLFTPRLV